MTNNNNNNSFGGLTQVQKVAAVGGTVLFGVLYAYAAFHSNNDNVSTAAVAQQQNAQGMYPVPVSQPGAAANSVIATASSPPEAAMLMNAQSVPSIAQDVQLPTSFNKVLGGNLSEQQIEQIEEESPNMMMTTTNTNGYVIPKDPSNITYKPYMSNQKRMFTYPQFDLKGLRRPLNVLSIGGAHTSGETLDNKYDAYPYLLGHPFHNHVDVLSYRPSGADYPAMCLESISVRDHGTSENSEEKSRAGYDLILLDFNLNGSDGLELLVKRLRHRYPDSVIVFVGLWSLLTSMEEKGTGKTILDYGHDITKEWVWNTNDFYLLGDFVNKGQDCTHEICTLDDLKHLLDTYDAMVYEFPKPSNPMTCIEEGWFNENDWHHLSEKGHQVLSNGLIHFLDTHHHEQLFNNYKTINEWSSDAGSGGDQCYNWMSSGNNPLQYSGAEMVDLLANRGMEDVHRWALTFTSTNNGGDIIVDSKFNIPVPAALAFFAKGDGSTPMVNVRVNNGSPTSINPIEYIPKETPFDKSKAKQMTYAPIGNVMPGKNIISVELPSTTTASAATTPFEVTGLYLCAACAQDGHLSF